MFNLGSITLLLLGLYLSHQCLAHCMLAIANCMPDLRDLRGGYTSQTSPSSRQCFAHCMLADAKVLGWGGNHHDKSQLVGTVTVQLDTGTRVNLGQRPDWTMSGGYAPPINSAGFRHIAPKVTPNPIASRSKLGHNKKGKQKATPAAPPPAPPPPPPPLALPPPWVMTIDTIEKEEEDFGGLGYLATTVTQYSMFNVQCSINITIALLFLVLPPGWVHLMDVTIVNCTALHPLMQVFILNDWKMG
ncbi:hypothetical protein BDR05DRAFT_954045 [Suillus weaverae]|nr:hypothetical protein BDR05DRAFT_954045 [Suillus weaverae]